jgi:hypothetical protein
MHASNALLSAGVKGRNWSCAKAHGEPNKTKLAPSAAAMTRFMDPSPDQSPIGKNHNGTYHIELAQFFKNVDSDQSYRVGSESPKRRGRQLRRPTEKSPGGWWTVCAGALCPVEVIDTLGQVAWWWAIMGIVRRNNEIRPLSALMTAGSRMRS